MTDTTTCPTCSATLPAAAAFCTNCGARLGAATTAPPPPVDPTRVDGPPLTDATQAFPAPPAPPIAPPPPPIAPPPPPTGSSAPWQPAADPAGPWSEPATAPTPPADAPAWVQAAQALSTAPPPPTTAGPPIAGAPAPGIEGPRPAGASEGSPVGAILALVGGVLTLVGTFLPWVTSNLSDAGLSGWDLTSGDKGFRLPDGSLLTFESLDPYALVALGALSLFVGVMSFGGATRRVARILAVGTGVAVIALLVRDWTSLAAVVSDKAPVGFEVESAIGFYLAIAGGGLTALSALMPAKG